MRYNRMDLPDYKFNEILEKSIVNVGELSGKMEDYLKLVSEFGRTGKNDTEALALADTTTVLQNISDLNAEDAVNALTAAQISFNIAAEDSIMIADKLNEVDNNYSITTKDLTQSLMKASSTAATFGVSLDQLIGYTTAVGAATRESGSIVGNSLKSIFARITTNDSSISALDAIGISMNKASGEAKNSAELIEEVAGRWDGLTEAEQRNTAVGVAGIYQLSRWNALMLNFGMSQDAAATAMDSQNSAMREQEEYSKSLEARINRLKTEWVSFASTAGDAILYDGIVAVTEILKNFTSDSNSVVSFMGALAPIFGIAGVAAFALSTSLRGLINSQIAAATATVATTGATGTMATAMIAGTTAVNVMKVALRGLLIASGVGAVLAALGFVVEKLTKAYSASVQATEEFDSYTRKNTDALTTNKEAVESLIFQYNQLSAERGKDGWDTKKEEELLKIQQTLGEMYPALISYTDSSGQAHLKTSEEIQKQVDATRELVKAQNDLTVSDALAEFEKLSSAVSGGAFDSIGNFFKGNLNEQIKTLQNDIKVLEEMNDKNTTASRTTLIDEMRVDLLKLEAQVQDSSDKIKGHMVEVANAVSGIDIDSTIQKNLEGFLRSLDVSNLDTTQLRDFAEDFGRLQAQIQEALSNNDEDLYKNTITSLNNLASTAKNADFKEFAMDYEEMVQAVNSGNVVFVDGEQAMEDYAGTAEEANKIIDDLTKNISYINGVLEDYAENNTLSADSLVELTNKYPELIAHINDEGEMIKALEKIRDNDVEAARKQLAKKIDDSTEYYNTNLKMIEEYFKKHFTFYDGDLKQFQNLAQAKMDVDTQLIKSLADKWKVYYSTVTNDFMPSMKEWTKGTGSVAIPGVNFEESPEAKEASKRMKQANDELQSMRDKLDNFSLDQVSLDFSKMGTSAEKAGKSGAKAVKENNKELENSIYLADLYKQKMEELNLAIAQQVALRDNLTPYSAEFTKSLEKQMKLEQDKLAAMKAQEASLMAQISSGKIQETGLIKQEKTAKSISKELGGIWATGRDSSGYGMRKHPTLGVNKSHNGMDIAAPKGTSLPSNVSGKVVRQGFDNVSGNYIKIEDSQGYKHFYGHLDKAFVKLGDMVQAGQEIGKIGSTGRSTGSHLHYEIKNALNEYINPKDFVQSARNNKVTTTTATKTAGTIAAENAQSVDQARSDLISIQNEIINQQKNIKNLSTESINALLSVFDRRRDKAQEVYSYEEAKLKSVDKFSERYGKTIDIQRQQLVLKQSANNDELEYLDKLLKSNTLTADVQAEMKIRYNNVKTAIQEVNNEMGKLDFSKFTVNEEIITRQNDLLAYNAVVLESLSKGSERYQKILEENEGILRTKQKTNEEELRALNKMIESGKYSGEVLEEMTARTNELFIAVRELALEIQNNNFDIIMNIKTNFDESQDDIQFDIDKSQIIQDKYVEGSKLWRDEVDKQIVLYGELASSHDQERRKLQEELKSRDLTAEQIKEMTELLEDETLAYLNATTAIDKLKKEMVDTEKKLKKEIADNLIDAYKAYVGERRDEHMKMLDDELKAETKRHEARKKQLQDEMDLFRKNVEERLRLIDRQEAERGYNMEIEEMEKERSKIQGEVDKLSLDDSREAKSKRKKLQEQLDKIDKDIAEKRHDRDIELQKQGLNDLLESKEQEIDGKLELEDKEYQAVVDRINREKEYWTKHYTDLLNDERKFAQLREDIMSGSFDKIEAEFQVYIQQMIDTMPLLEDSMDGTMQAVGTSIRQNVIDALNDAISKMGEFNSMSISGGGNSGGVDGGTTPPFNDNFNPNEGKNDMIGGSVDKNNPASGLTNADMMVLFAKYMREQLVGHEPNEKNKQALRDKADALASQGRRGGSQISPDVNMHTALAGFSKSEYQRFSQYVLSSGVNQVSQPSLKEQVKMFGKRIASLDTGGMLSTSGRGVDGKGGGYFIGHNGEVVNNPLETSQLLKTAEISNSILSKLSNLVQPLLQLPQLQLNSVAGEAPIHIQFGDIYNSSQDSAKSFARTIINDIKTRRG